MELPEILYIERHSDENDPDDNWYCVAETPGELAEQDKVVKIAKYQKVSEGTVIRKAVVKTHLKAIR